MWLKNTTKSKEKLMTHCSTHLNNKLLRFYTDEVNVLQFKSRSRFSTGFGLHLLDNIHRGYYFSVQVVPSTTNARIAASTGASRPNSRPTWYGHNAPTGTWRATDSLSTVCTSGPTCGSISGATSPTFLHPTPLRTDSEIKGCVPASFWYILDSRIIAVRI